MKDRISYSEFVALCRGEKKIKLTEAEKEKIRESRKVFEEILEANPETAYYGVNTGVGALLDKRIPKDRMGEFQENLIMSHACGIGKAVEKEIVKGMMLHMILNLRSGNSSIRLETLELLIKMFNANIIPIVPEKGSLGASGDLVPQAHIALALIRDGGAKLEAGEAIALLNGTSFMTSFLAFSVFHADNLIRVAEMAAAFTSKALDGSRPLQSAYSLRCIPQVHGTVRDVLRNTKEALEKKINDFSGNPVILAKEKKIFQGSGNFHGQSLSQAADNLSIALATLANISERRIERLLNPNLSGLTPFLAKNSGLNTGLMIAQYTAASLVSENKTLAHPASVDSISVSAGQEDFVSMGAWATRKCWEICRNAEYVIAIELLCASQAFHPKEDRVISEEIERIYRLIHGGESLRFGLWKK